MLPELPDQILTDVDIGSVTADRAYDTRKCHDAIADRGAHAVIPPRRNAKPWKPSTAGDLAKVERVSPPKSRRDEDATYVKLLGLSLMARDFDRQAAEFQIRAAVLNG